jgi:hypothetical protein
MTPKKDAYIPPLRVPEDLAKRIKVACQKLSVDLPDIRRESLEDLARIAESEEKLVRPIRNVTNEMVASIAQAASADDIEKIFAPRRFNILRPQTAAAIAAVAVFASFMAGRITMMTFNHEENRQMAVTVSPAIPSPSLSPVQIIEKTRLAEADASPTPASTEEVAASPTPGPVAEASPTPEPPAPAPPARHVPEPEISKHRHIPLIARETKDAAVKRASEPWDDKEKIIDKQLDNLNRRIAAAPDGKKQALTKKQASLQQRKYLVRTERRRHKDDAKIAWDKAHGQSTMWDSLTASLGL